MSQILPNTTRAEDAKIYLKRINALDPYSAYLTSTILSSKDVPENVVLIERLDYKPGSSNDTEQPEWTSSFGLIPVDKAGPSEEPLPEWLTGIRKPQTPREAEKVEPQEAKLLPVVPEEVAQSIEIKVAPSDIPQWLREIAPPSPIAENEIEKISTLNSTGVESTPHWLRKINPSQETWEASNENLVGEAPASTSTDELPDWLKALGNVSPNEQQSIESTSEPGPQETNPESLQEFPKWLQELKTLAPSEAAVASPSSEDISPSREIPTAEQASQNLIEAQPPPAQPAIEIPEWLKELGKDQTITTSTSEIQPSTSFEAVEGTTPDSSNTHLTTETHQTADAIPAEPGIEDYHQSPEAITPVISELIPPPLAPSIDNDGELPGWLQDLLATEEVTPEPAQEAEVTIQRPDELQAAAQQETLAQQEFIAPVKPMTELSQWLPEVEIGEETIPSQQVAAPPELEKVAQEPANLQELLQESQAAFLEGKVELALRGYTQLLDKGVFVDETIHDLRDSLSRFPADISIWEVLGDAYVRSNRIQDALDAFIKAEELLR